MGMRVVAFDPAIAARLARLGRARRRAAARSTTCSRDSDVVSLHLPLADATRGLIDEARLARMKPGAILVNSARGGIVDEAALARALREGRLARRGAGRLRGRSPSPAGSVLADAPNLILTPHIAGVTLESNERVSSLIAERVAAFLTRWDRRR